MLTTTTTATILVATPAGAQAPAAPVATGLSWGSNNYGELGDGTMTARNRPVNTVGLPNLTAMSAGSSGAFSVALDELGNVWAWGTNTQGELGDGTTTPHGTPIKVPGLTRVTQVTAGGAHVLALRSDGTVWAWGDNRYGQLGAGQGPEQDATPKPVPGLTDVKQISAGEGHNLALKADGTVWGWGYNEYGQLGTLAQQVIYTPVQIHGIGKVVAQLSAGTFHSVALRTDGSVWAWGSNGCGQVSPATSWNAVHTVPVRIPRLSGVLQVSAGRENTLVVSADGYQGRVLGWGCNSNGELASEIWPITFPVPVDYLPTDMVEVSHRRTHTMALRADGTVWTWGANNRGQLGIGITGGYYGASQVPGLRGVRHVAAGYAHSLAIAPPISGNIPLDRG
ncbi:hypothetical protein I6A81_29235 [Frankia sp. CN7]|nr:hypothetical protein [Frankia nepalensis]